MYIFVWQICIFFYFTPFYIIPISQPHLITYKLFTWTLYDKLLWGNMQLLFKKIFFYIFFVQLYLLCVLIMFYSNDLIISITIVYVTLLTYNTYMYTSYSLTVDRRWLQLSPLNYPKYFTLYTVDTDWYLFNIL